MIDIVDKNLIEIRGKIDKRYAAVIKNDFQMYKAFWSDAPQGSIEQALYKVVEELEDFLDKRQTDITKFVKEAQKKQDFLKELFEVEESKYSDLLGQARLNYFHNFLLETYLQRAIQDFHDIRRVAHQRDFYQQQGNTCALETLKKADQQAIKYFEWASQAGLIAKSPGETETITPICYFDKTISINRVPYTKLPLISLPITAIEVAEDISAVAHEMGHYIFNHLAAKRKKSVETKLAGDISTEPYRTDAEKYKSYRVSNWLEETFADVFSSIIDPDYDEQFQNFLLSRSGLSQAAFEEDDQHHAPTLIRPYTARDKSMWDKWTANLMVLGIDRSVMKEKAEPWLKEMADILEKEITGGKDHIDIEKISRAETYEGDYSYSKVDQEPLDLDLDQIRRKFVQELERWGSVGLPIICHNC